MAYTKVTLLDLKEKLKARMGNAQFWTEAELVLYLNEALRVWNVMTWQWRGSSMIPTVTAQIYYDTSTFLNVTRVVYNGIPLSLTSLFTLDQAVPGWQPTMGVPLKWFPVGATQIGIYPSDEATGQLVVHGIVPAPQLTADTDFLDLGEWTLQALMDYVEHIACFKQGGSEFEASMELYKSFVKAAGITNSKFQLSGMYRRVMGADLEQGQRPHYDNAGQKTAQVQNS